MKPCPPAKRWARPSRARKRTKTRRAFLRTRAIGGRLRAAAVFNLLPGNRAVGFPSFSQPPPALISPCRFKAFGPSSSRRPRMMKPCPPAKRWVGPSRARKRTKTRRAFPGTRAIGGRLRAVAVFNLLPGNCAVGFPTFSQPPPALISPCRFKAHTCRQNLRGQKSTALCAFFAFAL